MQDKNIKDTIQRGFDTVAQGYDHPSLYFFPETAKRMVEHLKLQADNTLLDVCTGTGVVALAAAEQLPRGRVTGIDLSSGMLEQARSKAASRKLMNTEFIQMDLDELDLPDQSYNVASSSFGLFFLEDMTHALKNIARKVRPGGKLAISTFTGEAFSPMADIFIRHFEETGREVPSLSWKRLSTHELIREQFNAVGIDEVKIHHEPLGYQMTSAEMWWDVVWNAGWRSLLNMMPEDEQQHFKSRHMHEIKTLVGKHGVWFNTEVLIAVGTLPS